MKIPTPVNTFGIQNIEPTDMKKLFRKTGIESCNGNDGGIYSSWTKSLEYLYAAKWAMKEHTTKGKLSIGSFKYVEKAYAMLLVTRNVRMPIMIRKKMLTESTLNDEPSESPTNKGL